MSTASLTPEQAPPLSETKRLLNVIIDPVATFGDLLRTSRWWSPWLLVSIVSLLFMVLLSQRVGFDQIAANQIASSSRAEQMDKMPPAQRQQVLAQSATITRYVSFAIPLTLLLVYVVTAGVLLGVFNLGMGAQLKFPTTLAIVTYAGLVHLVGTVLAAAMILVPGFEPEKFNISNPSGTNPAYYLDPVTTNKFLYTMLSGVDVVVIWNIILLGIGVGAVSKVKRVTTILAIAGLYLGWKLITGALAAAF